MFEVLNIYSYGKLETNVEGQSKELAMKNSAQNMKPGDVSLGLSHHFIGAFGRAGGTTEMLQLAADDRQLMQKIVGLFQLTVLVAPVASALLTLSTTHFDPVAFEGLGKGWSIAEQDEQALALTEVDLNKVTFETMLRGSELSIKGEEKLKRLIASGKIRLDAKVFETLWENQHLIPESWKSKEYIFFDGTVLRDPNGSRFVLFLYWRDGAWYWGYNGLGHGWLAKDPSACLAS